MKTTTKPTAKLNIVKAHSNLGKWVEKPLISKIVVCVCGNKYIKTRKGQTVCIKCLYLVSKK